MAYPLTSFRIHCTCLLLCFSAEVVVGNGELVLLLFDFHGLRNDMTTTVV